MVRIDINSTSAIIRRQGILTSGMVGAIVEFRFSEDWDGLTKTVVFRGGGVTKDVLDVVTTATIPHEVLKIPGVPLEIGVYGINAEGTVIIPTVWAKTDLIKPGADPSGDESADPSLPVWEQVYQKVDKSVEESLSDAKASGEFRGDAGPQGPQGEKGDPGAPGYTPQKGTDYYTDADKEEMVQAVLAALPDGDEVSY